MSCLKGLGTVLVGVKPFTTKKEAVIAAFELAKDLDTDIVLELNFTFCEINKDSDLSKLMWRQC